MYKFTILKNKADNIEEHSQDDGYDNENQAEEEEQKLEPTEAETPAQTPKPGAETPVQTPKPEAKDSLVTRNSNVRECGAERTREGNNESTEWDFRENSSRERDSQPDTFENRKSPEGNLENSNVPTRQSPVGESEVKVKGNDNLDKKVDGISSEDDDILDKQSETEAHGETQGR